MTSQEKQLQRCLAIAMHAHQFIEAAFRDMKNGDINQCEYEQKLELFKHTARLLKNRLNNLQKQGVEMNYTYVRVHPRKGRVDKPLAHNRIYTKMMRDLEKVGEFTKK
jgi:hypothetical protein